LFAGGEVERVEGIEPLLGIWGLKRVSV